jgi:cytochrome b pre-mRNA-processing protein 3
MLKRLIKPRPAKAAGQALYLQAVAQARTPEFYRDLGAPDRIDARFELYALHVLLLVRRLSGQGAAAGEVSQALFDAFLGALDDTLRELGVGDLSVARKMRSLGEAIYGRALSLGEALERASAPQGRSLEALVARTVFADEAALERAGPIANYLRRAQDALADQSLDEILQGRPAWPRPLE